MEWRKYILAGILRDLKAIRVPTLLIQINHWNRAVATQIVNFPNAIHLNRDAPRGGTFARDDRAREPRRRGNPVHP
jgi:hypothetical protein